MIPRFHPLGVKGSKAQKERMFFRCPRKRPGIGQHHYSITSSAPAIRRTGVSEYWIELPRQSALMLDARVTLPHLPVSSAINLPKSPGESASTVPPRSARLTFMLGSARAALISLLSLSTISVGVFFGAPRPYQPLAS